MDESGAFVLDHNDNPIPVLPEEDKRLMLGSKKTGGHGGLFWVKVSVDEKA